jgi:hypothetical protein
MSAVFMDENASFCELTAARLAVGQVFRSLVAVYRKQT